MTVRPLLTALALALASSLARDARAGGPTSEAEAAYDAATKAHGAADYAQAARLFAVADELAPNPVALETAIREAILANLPALAIDLTLRAARETAPSQSLSDAIAEAKSKFQDKVGFVAIECDACAARLAGEKLRTGPKRSGVVNAVETGARSIELSTSGGAEVHPIEVSAGATVTVEPNPKIPPAPLPVAPPVAPAPVRLHGIHPAWITIGIAGTAALGGASIASYVDARSIEDTLQQKRDQHDPSGADELISRGKAAEARTYVLEGLCAGSGLAALLVGILAIDWNGPEPDSPKRAGKPAVSLSPGGVSASFAF